MVERIRICFGAAPYLDLEAHPIYNSGVDVTELPGIASWVVRRLDLYVFNTPTSWLCSGFCSLFVGFEMFSFLETGFVYGSSCNYFCR